MSKQIALTRLELHNFKGAKNLVVEFHPDRPTIISGRNGSGKTTIMDAFMWLLWGTNADQQQTAKFGIKPNTADGTPRLDLDTEVEGRISITDTETGETSELTAKRRWVSMWKTKSGEVEKEYNGNKGEYFINDVPVKESEYNATISRIIPPEIFKTITNPYYFPSLPWQKRREILLGMTTDATYEDIAKGHAEFEQLLRDITGKTVADFNAEVGAAISRINKRLDEIPGLITEAERATPITPDYAALAAEEAEIKKELASINATLAASSESTAIREAARTETLTKQAELRNRQLQILEQAQNNVWVQTREANARREELQQQLADKRLAWKNHQNNTQGAIIELQAEKSRIAAEVKRMTAEQDGLRSQWYAENEKTYTPGGQLVCPITKGLCTDPTACYQHSQNEAEARQAFNETQRHTLDILTERGQKLGERIAEANAKIAQLDEKIQTFATEQAKAAERYKADGKAIAAELDKTPEVKLAIVSGEDLPEWVSLQQEIERLQRELDSNKPEETTIAGAATQRQKTLTDRLAEINRKQGLRMIIEQQEKRVQELNAEEQTLLQERANLQKQQKLIERMTKARMTELEKRINSLFKLVRFEMFEPTATTGEEKPNCVCWVGDVKYNDKNRAGKVHAGLDIINALCAYHRITAPVFIDEAEGVNEFIPTESQLILLKVTTDDFKVE